MELDNIYIYALKELDGFDEEAIEIAISLANHDVVETIEEFIDFVNYNIEDRKFPHVEKPFEERIIKKAVNEARKNEWKNVHSLSFSADNYPQKLTQSRNGHYSDLSYMGSIKNIERKTILITGSSSITKNAKLASKYLGKLFADNGYNIITSFSEGCEMSSISGCIEASGVSTFFLPHSIEQLSAKEKKVIQKELGTGHSTLMSASSISIANKFSIEDTYRYIMAITDCVIVPQLSFSDDVLHYIMNYLDSDKPVYFIKYITGGEAEYDCSYFQNTRKVKYISSKTALREIKDAIGEARGLFI